MDTSNQTIYHQDLNHPPTYLTSLYFHSPTPIQSMQYSLNSITRNQVPLLFFTALKLSSVSCAMSRCIYSCSTLPPSIYSPSQSINIEERGFFPQARISRSTDSNLSVPVKKFFSQFVVYVFVARQWEENGVLASQPPPRTSRSWNFMLL